MLKNILKTIVLASLISTAGMVIFAACGGNSGTSKASMYSEQI